jgi:imidazolonepropionase-like amidohydrolase
MEEMTFEEISAICQEAHKFQRRVAAHVSGGQGITDAIQAGVDSLEHAHWLTDEQIGLMADKGTFYVPTLIVNSRSLVTRKEQADLSSTAWEWLFKADEAKWDSLARAKAAGVKIATGSDAGFLVNHGESACEIAELVRGGFTPAEALTAATRTSAECLGMERDIGTLEAGKLADFVMVDGNPLEDVNILMDESRIAQVYKDGRRLK